MSDPNTDNNGASVAFLNVSGTEGSFSPPKIVIDMDYYSPKRTMERQDSASTKSPAKSDIDKDNLEKHNKTEGNPFAKQKSPNKNDKLKLDSAEANSDSEDSPETRQRSDRVVFSPKGNGANGNEIDFSSIHQNTGHRLEKSQSIVETDISKDYESLPRTYTQVVQKPVLEHSASLLLPARNSDITKSMNVGKDLKFIDKEKWTDELKCYVCSRNFNKMDGIFTHHCRACGKSVCGDCSTRKINENRACDVCFYKVSNAVAEERRKNELIEKTRLVKEYKKRAEDAQKHLQELAEKKKALEKKIYDEREEQDKAFIVLQKEKVKVYENLDQKKLNNKKLKETLEDEQAFLKKKEENVREMKEDLNAVKIGLAEQRGNIKSKQEESDRLGAQKQYYENSIYLNADFQNYQNDQNDQYDDSNDVPPRSASIGDSCDPNLPETEEAKKEIEEPTDPNSDSIKSEDW